MLSYQNKAEIILFYSIIYSDKGYVDYHCIINILYSYENTQDCLKNTDHVFCAIACLLSSGFLSQYFSICVLFSYSDHWIPLSILVISWSITSTMHMWSFCTRASSGFQYEINSRVNCSQHPILGKTRKDNTFL